MKKRKIDIAGVIFQVWTIGLFLMFAVAIGYLAWAMVTGNYASTASREF